MPKTTTKISTEDITPDTITAFWAKVDIDPAGCWEWKIHKGDNRYYPRFSVPGIGIVGAHRVAYLLSRFELPDSLVLHTCDNRRCVRPDHLYCGDYSDNLRDRYERGPTFTRSDGVIVFMSNGRPRKNSPLLPEQVSEVKKMLRDGARVVTIARHFEVSESMISHIKHGRTWRHIK